MNDVCRRIAAVDITPLLAVLPSLSFTEVNVGSRDPGKSPCAVYLGALPGAFGEFVKSLNLGGETRRMLLRKLKPRQGMAPHVDTWMPSEADWRRFQVPIVTHPEVIMRWPEDGVSVHLEAGFVYEVRYDRLHEVVNGADCDRIHLQIDQINATI